MEIEKRLAEIEKSNRWLTLVCAGLLLVVIVAISAGAKDKLQPHPVVGTQFQLVDDQGVTRGTWLVRDGVVRLQMFGEGSGVSLEVSKSGSAIAVGAKDETAFASLQALPPEKDKAAAAFVQVKEDGQQKCWPK